MQSHVGELATFFPLEEIFGAATPPEKIMRLGTLVTSVVSDLGREVDTFGRSYSLSRAFQAFSVVEKLMHHPVLQHEQDFLKVLQLWKEQFVGGPPDAILQGQWKKTLSDLSTGVFLLGQFQNLSARNKSLLSSPGLDELDILFNQLLESWHAMGDPVLDLQKIRDFLKTFEASRELFGYSKESAISLLDTVFVSMSHGPTDTVGRQQFGRPQIEGWVRYARSVTQLQRQILAIAAVENPQLSFKAHDSMESLHAYRVSKKTLVRLSNPRDPLNRLFASGSLEVSRSQNQGPITRPFRRFFEGLLYGRPLWTHPTIPYRLKIDSSGREETSYSVLELSLRGIYWALQSRIFQSYSTGATDSAGRKNELNEPDFNRLYLDVRNFGIEQKWFDPTSWSAAELRHREADLFMPTSNGDGLMELNEAVDLFVALVSTRNLAFDLHRHLMKTCATASSEDYTGFPPVDTECLFSETFSSYLPTLQQSYPALVNFYKALSQDEKAEFVDTFRAMFAEVVPQPMSSYVITERLASVLQYEELLLSRFDANHSGSFERDELDALYNLLADTLKRAIRTDDDIRGKAVLAYLLQKGKMPDASLLRSLLFLWYESHPASWSFQADRKRIFEVFRLLAEATQKLNQTKPVSR